MHSAYSANFIPTKDKCYQNVIQQQLAMYLQMKVLRTFAESVAVMVKCTTLAPSIMLPISVVFTKDLLSLKLVENKNIHIAILLFGTLFHEHKNAYFHLQFEDGCH